MTLLKSLGPTVAIIAVGVFGVLWIGNKIQQRPAPERIGKLKPTKRMEQAVEVVVDLPPAPLPDFTDDQVERIARKFGVEGLVTVEEFRRLMDEARESPVSDDLPEPPPVAGEERDDDRDSPPVGEIKLTIAELETDLSAPWGFDVGVFVDLEGRYTVEPVANPRPFLERDWKRTVLDVDWRPDALGGDGGIEARLKWQPLRFGPCRVQAGPEYDTKGALDVEALREGDFTSATKGEAAIAIGASCLLSSRRGF